MAKKDEVSLFEGQKINKPSYDDASKEFLFEEQKADFDKLVNYLANLKIKPSWYATNSYNFKYKGKIIIRFQLGHGGGRVKGNLKIFLMIAEREDLDDVLTSASQDMRDFYFRNFRRCIGCNPVHVERKTPFKILGDEYLFCTEPEISIHNPSANDIDTLIKFVDLRIDNIKIKEKFSNEKTRV